MPLRFQSLNPKEFLVLYNNAYAESRNSDFKEKLKDYLESLDKHKNQNEKAIVSESLKPFLQSLGFQAQAAYKHKGNSEIDLALLKSGNVEIIIEAKKSENTTEMLSESNPNCKALHECILYYLRERENNTQLKHILITDFYQFYIFKAKEFERHFYKNKAIQAAYQSLQAKDLLENQKDFYAEIAKILGKISANDSGEDSLLQGIYFDLRNDKHLESASKILSKEFLHNEFKKDSNALNPQFYFELLHILGLKETDNKGKILIQIDNAQESSFAKHIASKLESQNQPSDFETTMSHIILWLNRILFLKLIEANLLHFNDFDENLKFLTSAKIKSFKALSHLFFEVLAKDYAERGGDKGFNFLPYLNSSLFIRDEKEICDLSTLDDDLQIFPFSTTQTEHKKGEPVRFLKLLFDFLECFDFGKGKDSTPSDKLINSSVLGAMFEKLNGYQEGSFYTPNFITSYMCKESLSKIVVEKFNTAFGWDAKDLESLRKQIDRNFSEKEVDFKRLLESIRICDPSVGSGHFLVSALNEMIGIYHHLGLLGFGYKSLEVQDDEILLTTKNNTKFAYQRSDDENHQIQITLFNLKKSIIENNLFGVDINPNSCNIARLRLWIELLKNAYYLNFAKDEDSKIHKLQTLPNIDINIKCGNSLISNINTNITLENFTQNLQERQKKVGDLFINASLESQIKDTQRKAQIKFQEMRENVESYKNENDKQASRIYKQNYEESYQYLCELFKRNCDEYINFYQELEYFFQQYGYINLRNLEEQTRFHIESYVEFFDFHKSVDFERKAQREIPQKELENLLSLMQIYEDFNRQATFEWRFAFPEVLDSNGDFLGFDLVIGNPPYIRQEEIKHLKPQLQKVFEIYKGTSDIYTYFFEQGYKILKHNGIISFITSNKWCRAAYGEPLRKFLLENTTINTYLDLNGIKVFESATVDTSILELHKAKADENHSLNYANPKDYNPKDEKPLSPQYSKISQNTLSSESFIFSDSKLAALKAKIERLGTPLKDWDINIYRGILTGYNEAFIIDTKKREEILSCCKDKSERARTEELIKPILRGRDIKRYSYEWAGLWIIGTFPALKLDIEDYPAVKNYLLTFGKRLEQNGEKNIDGIRGNNARKKTSNKWFETQDNIAYYQEFAKPKIVYSEIVREPQFYLDNGEFKFGHFYAEATSFILSGNESFESSLEYLLGILHSKLATFAFKEFYAGGGLGENGYRYKKAFLEKLPIPKISKKQEKEFVELVQEIVKIKQNGGAVLTAHNEQAQMSATKVAPPSTADTDKTLESRLDSMVYKLYGLDNEEIAIIGGGGQYKIVFALLLVSAIHSKLLELVKALCENFETKLKEAFRFCKGLQVPSVEKQAKISWQRVTQEPSFIVESDYYLLDSMAFLTHYSLSELHYLLGFLNSKAIFYYFKHIGHLYSDKGFLLSNQYVERFPIPKIADIDAQTHKEILACVKEILEIKNACHSETCLQAEESHNPPPNHLRKGRGDSNTDTSKLESRLDSLIYQAYNLTQDEIALIESEFATRERERERTEIIENLYYLLESFVRDSNTQYQGKIIWAEMTNAPCFAYDTKGFYINQTCYFIPTDNKYLCAILNSKLIYFYMRQMASSLGDGAFRWIKQYIEKLPIPKITESNQHLVDRIVALVDEILKLKAKDSTLDTSKLESQIDSLAYELYHLSNDEIKIVENK